MAVKDANRVNDDRKKDGLGNATNNMAAGKGMNTVAADHVGSETCAQTIARATK